jgi:hypothetical protein
LKAVASSGRRLGVVHQSTGRVRSSVGLEVRCDVASPLLLLGVLMGAGLIFLVVFEECAGYVAVCWGG